MKSEASTNVNNEDRLGKRNEKLEVDICFEPLRIVQTADHIKMSCEVQRFASLMTPDGWWPQLMLANFKAIDLLCIIALRATAGDSTCQFAIRRFVTFAVCTLPYSSVRIGSRMLFSITSSSKRWIAVAVGAPYDLILLRRILVPLYDLQTRDVPHCSTRTA
jgi:hypothetical protein